MTSIPGEKRAIDRQERGKVKGEEVGKSSRKTSE